MLTDHEIRIRIIRRLVNWKKRGGSHTENIIGGLPSHLRGDKSLSDVAGFSALKKTGEMHYSLNPDKTDEIMQFNEDYCKE